MLARRSHYAKKPLILVTPLVLGGVRFSSRHHITRAAGFNVTSGVNSFRFNASLARFEVNRVAFLINRLPFDF